MFRDSFILFKTFTTKALNTQKISVKSVTIFRDFRVLVVDKKKPASVSCSGLVEKFILKNLYLAPCASGMKLPPICSLDNCFIHSGEKVRNEFFRSNEKFRSGAICSDGVIVSVD
jgi:hypothetical protein